MGNVTSTGVIYICFIVLFPDTRPHIICLVGMQWMLRESRRTNSQPLSRDYCQAGPTLVYQPVSDTQLRGTLGCSRSSDRVSRLVALIYVRSAVSNSAQVPRILIQYEKVELLCDKISCCRAAHTVQPRALGERPPFKAKTLTCNVPTL